MTIYQKKEPIITKASAAGQGGIGVVRISGDAEALDRIIQGLFNKNLVPRYATLLPVKDADQNLIDRAIVLRFVGPASYTGEDVLEIQAHGGIAVQQLIVERCLEVGADVGLRLARAGEFTERAFLNGRIDLAQAEAVADLIEASGNAAARAAARSLQGEFSRRVKEINDELVELRAYIEATIDFPEEEIEFVETGHVNEKIELIEGKLLSLSQSAMRGKVLRDGLTVVLVGAPNVGKSSLMNALAGEEVAIVTDIAGTTRDKIVSNIHLDGLSINLIDTAGVRYTNDKVEQIGIERTLKAVEDADVVLRISTAQVSETNHDFDASELIESRLRDGVVSVDVVNKIDLANIPRTDDSGKLYLSVKTGEGLEELISKLKELAGMSQDVQGDFLARSRHLDCLARALEHISILRRVRVGAEIGLDIAAEELRLAGLSLGEIVGQTVSDDLLGMIFSRFCIGK